MVVLPSNAIRTSSLFSTQWPVPLPSASSWRSHPAGGQSWLLKGETGPPRRCATGCSDAGSRLEAGCCSTWNTRMRPRTRLRVASAIGERLLGKFTRSHPSRSCSDLRDSRVCPACLRRGLPGPVHRCGRRILIGVRSDRPRGVLGFATCETSHPELAETLKPTKLHQWRSAKLDATLSPPSPPKQLRG